MDGQMNRPKPICPFNFFNKYLGGGGVGGGGGGGARVSDFFYKESKSEKKIFFWGGGGLVGRGAGVSEYFLL